MSPNGLKTTVLMDSPNLFWVKILFERENGVEGHDGSRISKNWISGWFLTHFSGCISMEESVLVKRSFCPLGNPTSGFFRQW